MKFLCVVHEEPNNGLGPQTEKEAQELVNEHLDYDETMARLKAERGVKHAPTPEPAMLKCSTCGALFIRAQYGPPAKHCGPCAALAVRRQKIEANARASKGAE